MKVTVTTRHLTKEHNIKELKQYALKKCKRIERYMDSDRDPSEVRFILSSEKFRDTAEILVNSASVKATSSVETNDMHSAIDSAVDSIVKQLRRRTDKIITTKRRGSGKSREEIVGKSAGSAPSNAQSGSITVHKLPGKPMSVEEASLQLRVSDANFVAFRNSASDVMNVLYLSRRGELILIEP